MLNQPPGIARFAVIIHFLIRNFFGGGVSEPTTSGCFSPSCVRITAPPAACLHIPPYLRAGLARNKKRALPSGKRPFVSLAETD